MASIVNERDLLLQNSTQRAVDVTLPDNVVPPALKAVTLSAPSTTFRVATDNSSSPSAITLNANLRAISGTPTMTWSVTPTGAATLTGTDYGVRTLTYANMAQDYCTVRVEVNDGGMIYFDELSFAKVRDGSKGVDGRRGSISTAKAVTGSTWSDAQALQALVDLGISTPLATDTVTLYNASTSYAEMRRYSGTAWVAVEASLPGSLLMDGSLGLTKFASGLEPVKVVSTLPTTKASNTVFLTSDSKLYRWNGTEYTKAVDGADIEANSITAGQIAAGAIKTDELDALAVTAAKIATGAVTADKVTAGAITTEKLLVTGLGTALNPDPNTQDISAWTGTGLSIVTDTTSPSGSTALECTGLGATVLTSKFPVDPTKNYKARIWTKQQSGTSSTYLTVAFYDATGTRISGTSNGAGWPGKGTFHYFGLVNGALPAAWTEYSISFGPGESAVLPSNARFMAIGVLSNYTGTGVQRVAAPLVHLKTTGDMVVDGTLTASKIDTRGLVIRDTEANGGGVLFGAGTALDWGLIGGAGKPADGATNGSNLVRKSTFEDGLPGSWDYAGIENRVNSGMPYAKNIYFHARDNLEKDSSFPVTVGEILFASGWLETLGITGYECRIGVRVTNAAGAVVQWLGIASIGPNTAWTYVTNSSSVTAQDAAVGTPWIQMDGFDFPANYQWVRAAGIYIGKQQLGANYITNTNQLTDGAGLGSTANWSNISNIPAFGNFAYLDSITSANISTYIAGAAIGNAYISDLNATKINAGTISSDRLDSSIITAKVANLTGAQIGDAQVNTLQIAGQAVTLPYSAYSATQITSANTPLIVQTVNVVSEGGKAFIFVTFTGVVEASNSNGTVKIYRGATQIYTETVEPLGYYAYRVSIAVVDTPPAGSHNYKVTYEGITAAYDVFAKYRALLYLETKR